MSTKKTYKGSKKYSIVHPKAKVSKFITIKNGSGKKAFSKFSTAPATKPASKPHLDFIREPGYKMKGRVLVPNNFKSGKEQGVIQASALKKGLEHAKEKIRSLADEIIETISGDYQIREIELEISFNSDGKFMGFGVGGATSIKIKIAPRNNL